jgi:glycosyltransferase involved in cell wall biosynthesis
VQLGSVLILTDHASITGGATSVAISQACALAAAGVEVEYFAGVGPIDARLTRAGVKVHCLDQSDILNDPRRLRAAVNGIWNASAARALAQFLKGRSAASTIVHVHSWVKCLSASIFAEIEKAGLASVVTLHDYFSVCPNGGFFDYQANQICRRRAMGYACLSTHCDSRSRAQKLWRVVRQASTEHVAGVPQDLKNVIYISRLSRQILEPYFGSQTRWHAVRNPISVAPSTRARAEDNDVFLFVGRMAPEKGAHVFTAAVAHARAKGRAIGDGPDRAALERDWPEIEFLGWLKPDEVVAQIRRARALVFPSLWFEGQPLVVQEALASGVPVIVGNETAAAECVDHGRTGLVFDQGNVESLSMAIRSLADNPSLVASMSAHAYESYWADPPDPSAHVRQLFSTYQEILLRHAEHNSVVEPSA